MGTMLAKHLKTYGGSVKRKGHTLQFVCARSDGQREAPSSPVWAPNNGSQVAITLLHAPSGNGKTSFLRSLYGRIVERKSSIDFQFAPAFSDDELLAVGYIPQHAHVARHWSIRELLSGSSYNADAQFITRLLPMIKPDDPEDQLRRLGELSGGQGYKVYVSSALERLRAARSDSTFLLLDETFDGLGAIEARRCLEAIISLWVQTSEQSLHILLVTHLDDKHISEITVGDGHDAVGSKIHPLRLTLSVTLDEEATKRVVIAEQNE